MKVRKEVFLTMLFAMLFMPLVAGASYPINQYPNITPIEKMQPNGEYVIYLMKEGKLQEAGKIVFDEFFRERKIDLSKYVSGEEKVKIRLVQKGGEAAHIDSIFLGGKPPVEVIGIEKGLMKLSRKDFDVSDAFGKSLEVIFENNMGDNTLELTARVEGVNRGIPFQFPVENLYRKIDADAHFYPYQVNSIKGDITIDGRLDEVSDQMPFFREYSRSVTGHPSDYTYGWVWNDDENLYVSMDFTPDNTMDGDKDFAKVYISTKNGIKEFKVSVPETRWGAPGFSYTNMVGYQHKVYEFKIPLAAIAEEGLRGNDRILLAFSAYGTAATTGCGNGSVVVPEQCDDGNTIPGDGCSGGCTIESGYICTGEPSACTAICGDGVRVGTEACDDSNTTPGDGCSGTCTVESGYTCTGNPSVCTPTCGDGSVVGTEACDDNNTTPGDGCSGTCTVESGYTCTGNPSVCTPTCGDGSVVGTEACDDSNTTPGDGCSGTCTVESGWNCSGQPSVCTAESDGDGVGNEVENAAPNGGDGNNDGIQDSVQSNVASLPSATGRGYITVVATGCGQLTNVYATTEAALPQQDDQYDYPFGLVGYTLTGCAGATVTITFHGTANLAGFISKKFDTSNLWYVFGTIATNTLTVNLTDNARGDSNPAVGTITDPVGPALHQVAIPIVTEWGVIIFMALAGFGALYSLRRQRRVQS
jgi:cysteine-rich repeat protein